MSQSSIPLAERSRPRTIDKFIGQGHLVGSNGPIRKMLERGEIFSMIFWGPPGSGKTTLARIIAGTLKTDYHELSAVSAGKLDIKKIIDGINHQRINPSVDSPKNILFLDEIHRFNRAQQDFLLPYVENGTITLIGATTENPSFEVISPLLSRCRTYVFHELTPVDLRTVVDRGLAVVGLSFAKEARELLVQYANGDARTALNVIDLAAKLFPQGKSLTAEKLARVIQDKRLRYDTTGEEHYNTISAFIKSMRACNIDAALYYLARMVEAGEDPLFIARRMVVFSSEDIGMAQPTALVVANEVFRACETIGYPECAINLAHGVAYLASAKKDRSAYNGLRSAQADVKQFGNLPIPLNLRNAPTKLMQSLGYGKGYKRYTNESLLPEKLKGKRYYSS